MPYSKFWDSLCERHRGAAPFLQEDGIVSKHAAVLELLIRKRELFLPRLKSMQHKTIDDGYYFIGSDRYLETTFWTGRNSKEKIYNIAFVVREDESAYLELAGETPEKRDYLERLQEHLGGFIVPPNRKKRWIRHFEGYDCQKSLTQFLNKLKPQISEFLLTNENDEFRPLVEDDCRSAIRKVEVAWRRNETQYMTRICWNETDWKYPSGRSGKSTTLGSFEYDNGYGHEEWLFARGKVIDGYQYGFLEALHKGDTHTGKTYNLCLFSIDHGPEGRKNYYVGEIRGAECITPEQSKVAYQIYDESGWLDEMRDQIRAVDGEPDALGSLCTPEQFFNIRFKFENVQLANELWELNTIPNHRYSMYKNPGEPNFITSDGDTTRLYDTNKTKVPFRSGYERDPRHTKIPNMLQEVIKLNEVYTAASIHPEKAYVDMRAVFPDQTQHFFEVKTSSPLRCIREALGRIMEYSYFPAAEKASRLIVIGEDLPDEATQDYLHYIRSKFGIPIYYRQANLDSGELSTEY